MAKSVTLPNGRSWTTQRAGLQHFKVMLARYEDGHEITDAEDHDGLLALLTRYDMLGLSEQSKLGAGVERFERRLNRGQGYATSGFWVIRMDGTETDFSYVWAVKGTPKPIAQQYYDACRNAVNSALAARKQKEFDRFADENGCLPCDISGIRVRHEEAQLRHAEPMFWILAERFRKKQKWDWDGIHRHLTVPTDAQISTKFRNISDAKAFKSFHQERAVLHIVSKNALSGRKRGVETQVKRPIQLKTDGGR